MNKQQDINSLEQDFDSFFSTPKFIYPSDFGFVSFSREKMQRVLSLENTLFSHDGDFSYWTAIRSNQPVGRIMAFISQAENSQNHTRRAYFGYLDCEENQETADFLLAQAESFARRRGCTEIVGNHNAVGLQMIGVVTRDFVGRHYHGQLYGAEYISKLVAKAGYEPGPLMITSHIDMTSFDPEVFLGPKQRELLRDPDFKLIPVGNRSAEELSDVISRLINLGFGAEPSFVKRSPRDVQFQCEISVPDLRSPHQSFLIEHQNKPIGMWLTVAADVQQTAIHISSSIAKEYQGLGISGLLDWAGFSAVKAAGNHTFAFTWTSNPQRIHYIEKSGIQVMHELRLFRKLLPT